ncbi:MAG: repeat-associated core domain [Segetibacter sp.]|nr:repeat-associated core domain [Segetibacter sp.]
MFKEHVLESGKLIDFLDALNGKIYELKPFNPRAMREGQRQLQVYKRELEPMSDFDIKNWETILETY